MGRAPVLESLNASAMENWGLGAVLTVTTSAPCTLEVEVQSEEGARILPASATLATGDKEYRVRVLGLRASTDYTFTVTGTSEGGVESDPQSVAFTTEALPDTFYQLDWSPTADFQAGEDGYVAFSVSDVTKEQQRLQGRFRRFSIGTEMWWDINNGLFSRFTPGTTRPEAGTPAREDDTLRPESGRNADGPMERGGSRSGQFSPRSSHRARDLCHIEFHPGSISGYPEGTLDVITDVVLRNLKDQTLEVLWDLFSTLDPFRVLNGFYSNYWTSTYSDVSDVVHDWTQIPCF